MNNNYYNMELFLNRIKKILQSNPQLINGKLDRFLYSQLIQFNLGNNSQPLQRIDHNFSNWIKKFRNVNNIDVFVDEDWNYFCQFTNGKDNIKRLDDMIKLYIPMDYNHIKKGVFDLFSFLSENNILHQSKVGSEVRNDSVVVRVFSIEDAKKVMDYVNNNNYIREGLLNVNPFTTNINGIGIAKDNKYSYNSVLCENIADLIFKLYDENALDKLNTNELNNYICHIKNTIYDKRKKEVLSLQYMNTSFLNMNLENFNIFYCEGKPSRTIEYACKETYKKYNDIDLIKKALTNYISSKDSTGFTRNNNARVLIDRLTSLQVKEVVGNPNLYIERLLNNNNINEIINNDENLYNCIVDAYINTYRKYGVEQAQIGLIRFINNNDSNYITNMNNARDNLISLVKTENIFSIIKHNLNIEYEIDDYELMEMFFSSIDNTYFQSRQVSNKM